MTWSPAARLPLRAARPRACEGRGYRVGDPQQEVMDLYRKGQYDRAVVVAQKALKVAGQNAGPEHPHVATSLEESLQKSSNTPVAR